MQKSWITYTSEMDNQQWLKFRFDNGIGASDIGCLLGLTNSWKSPLELYYQYLDFSLMEKEENLRMALGTMHEEGICELYKYWNGTVDGMLNNKREGRVINKISNVNGYIQNPKYPNLFVSLDRKIHKNSERGEGALEAKLISGWIARKYESGIPPAHLAQVQTQLLVCEFEYGDLAVLTDAQAFDVYNFNTNEDIQEIIVEKSADFWPRVQRGRQIQTQRYEALKNFNMRLVNELDAELSQLEPELVGGEAEEAFLKNKFKKPMADVGMIAGTDADMQDAKNLKEFQAQIKAIEEKASVIKNRLIKKIGAGNAIDFGALGKVKHENNRFSNLIK